MHTSGPRCQECAISACSVFPIRARKACSAPQGPSSIHSPVPCMFSGSSKTMPGVSFLSWDPENKYRQRLRRLTAIVFSWFHPCNVLETVNSFSGSYHLKINRTFPGIVEHNSFDFGFFNIQMSLQVITLVLP